MDRFLIYPLLMLSAMQFVLLARQDWRWHAGTLGQLVVVTGVGVAALRSEWLTGVAWGLLLVLIAVPRLLNGLALRQVMLRRFAGAARSWQAASWFVWGPAHRLPVAYAEAIAAYCCNDRAAGDATIRKLLDSPLPVTVRGAVHYWLLSILMSGRQWALAVDLFETAGDWGVLATATHARVLVARAYAEMGRFDRALRCLQFVVLSPRTISGVERQLWAARLTVAALAGDAAEVERLLAVHAPKRRRGFERFAALWRGRCALARGETAQGQLTRALALTPLREHHWREAIEEYLRQAEEANIPAPAADTPLYQHGMAAVRQAEETARPWRDLMNLEAPRGATLGLLAALAVIHFVEPVAVRFLQAPEFMVVAGNWRALVLDGEWWRLATAIFLHANWLHLAMNAAGLWMFGMAVERRLGSYAMLALFVVAGIAGNAFSVWLGEYDVSLGASGGLFGLLAAFMVQLYRLNVPLYAHARSRMLWLLAAMVAADFAIGGFEKVIDNLAHIGGFVAGLVLAILASSVTARCCGPK